MAKVGIQVRSSWHTHVSLILVPNGFLIRTCRSSSSATIWATDQSIRRRAYTKIALEQLREVALGDGEDVL